MKKAFYVLVAAQLFGTGCDQKQSEFLDVFLNQGLPREGALCLAAAFEKNGAIFGRTIADVVVSNVSGDNMVAKGEPWIEITGGNGTIARLSVDHNSIGNHPSTSGDVAGRALNDLTECGKKILPSSDNPETMNQIHAIRRINTAKQQLQLKNSF